MNNLLAAFFAVAVLGFTVPATGSEASFALRGVEQATVAQVEASSAAAPASASPAPVKKVRIILSSPYGN